MTKLYGETPNYLLFTDDENAVVIDKRTNMVDEVGSLSLLSSIQPWNTDQAGPASRSSIDLATGALADLRVQAVVSSGRMYTIPKAAQEEAKRALEWRKEHDRGGTPVGLNTARTLARGGQIGIQKVRHIAKYFPRHEVDKKAKGYKPGDDGFPSNGRIAWALWGGDAAWRWARAIVERENKKAMRADGYMFVSDESSADDFRLYSDYDADLNAFELASRISDGVSPEFIARVRVEDESVDRLYMVDEHGEVFVWDDGHWDDLGHVDSDIMTYDKALDDPYDTDLRSHIIIDPDSALVISAHMQQAPFSAVSVFDLDPTEAELVAAAADEVDWQAADYVLLAAGEDPIGAGDGVYTPEERSKKARKQVRDAGGKFAAMGSRVVIGGDSANSGNITGINPDKQSVTVKLDNGSEVEVPATSTEKAEDFSPQVVAPLDETAPLNLTGILGEPRAPIDRPKAVVPGGLPALTSDELQSVISDFPAWVKSQRDSVGAKGQAPTTPLESADKQQEKYSKYIKDVSGVEIYNGSYTEHPLFRNLFKKKPEYHLYYSLSIVSSAASKDKALSPEASDVKPVFMAVVSPEDPRAVFDLVSMVPASTKSTSPSTFKRVDKKWVKDDQILADLMSPTPPPVVPLHGEALTDVISQMDGLVGAAGGLDKNRGKAEKLRRYWVYGRGAAKIRWGTPGDWSRCVRHLSKYMGPRAKGYCNLRHKDALKMYPATHAKLLHGGRRNFSSEEFIMEEPVYGFDFDKMRKDKAKTIVTPEDLDREIEEIFSEHDDMYDASWVPDLEIIALIEEGAHEYESDEPITAAFEGGLDRNRGNAEKLRRYWLYGRGAAKIRWNTPGDWTRCYRHLRKYMGLRAKGYCSLRHKEATGVWPGSKFNVGKKNIRGSAFEEVTLATEQEIFDYVYRISAMQDAKNRVLLAGGDTSGHGAKFNIPLVIPEDAESGDGRKFEKGSIHIRELPLPLMWQIKTADGHNGSVVVGRIDHMERTDDGIGNAYGVFDSGVYGKEAERMVREGFIRGVSADLDQFEAKEEKSDSKDEAADDGKIGGSKININHARVMAVTIVPKPAFEECRIYIEDKLSEDTGESLEEEMREVPDGIYVEDMDTFDAQAIVACGVLAGAIPTVPPAEWFENPKLDKPTPLTVDDNGRVFGHIAAWHVNHIGMAYGTKPPRSKSKYSYFHTGVVRADNGNDYPVGQLTLAGGHASLEASAIDAARHYDDTGSAIADVHAGEDAHGIWVAGALRSSATPEQIRALRASAPSGDWRPINGALELVAVCQVNVPGFPIARARVASGQVYALVAAGAQMLAKLKTDPITELSQRIEALEVKEKQELTAKAEELAQRIRSTAEYDTLGYMSRRERERLAKEGKALPDGSYPIRNEEELKDAIQAYGRSKPGKRAAVRRHIMKKARGMGKSELIPENWKSASVVEEEIDAADLRARVASAQEQAAFAEAEAELASISQKVRERLAKEGKALPDGSYPIRNVSDLKNAIQAYGRSNPGDRAKVRRHIEKRARALGKADLIPENWKSASIIDEDITSLRARIASAKTVTEDTVGEEITEND